MDQISKFITTNQFQQGQNILSYIGLYYCTKGLINFTHFFYKLLFRSPLNLLQRYGKGSWVMITGGTDGIGKQFAMQLAQQGFNIIIVARNIQKLEKVQEEIQNLVQRDKQTVNVQIKVIQADFNNSLESDFFDKITEQVKDLDISFLINNVGIDIFKPLEQITDSEVMDQIKLNVLPVALLTKKILPKFLNRKPKKSGILNVASFGGVIPCPYFTVYSATKAFNIIFSKSLQAEYPEIDIMILNPSEVSTNMTYNREPDLLTITPESCAKWALGDMGHDEETDGHWNHKFQNSLSRSVPYPIFRYILKNILAPEWFKQRQEGEQKIKQQQKKIQPKL